MTKDDIELENICRMLTDEQNKLVNAVILSDRKSILLGLLRNFIHKNLTDYQLLYELQKNCNLIYLS
jgi:hypothetical protein